jgi:CHAT domain-containing protein
LTLACGFSCSGHQDPQAAFDRAHQDFLQGNLKQSQAEAEKAYVLFRVSNPEWAWKFRILEAEAALWQGFYEDTLKFLDSALPPKQPDSAVAVQTLAALADAYLHKFSEADQQLKQAEQLCQTPAYARCGDLLQARGILASQQGNFSGAEHWFELSLEFARARGDRFLESTSLLNLGDMSLEQGHFDEAIDRSQAADDAAKVVGARVVQLVTQGNIGWAYYKLGDLERALDLSTKAEDLAVQLRDVSDQENELTNIGYIYMDQRKFDLASQSFQRALQIAQDLKAKQDVYNALRVLARLELQQGDPGKATDYAAQALNIARESGSHEDELFPTLVQGQVAALRGDPAKAEQIFQAVAQDKLCPVFLKWEAQHSLAQLYEHGKQPDSADREYRAALATFESARVSLRRQDFQLSFLTNAARIYDDYVQFLVARKKPDEALRWADYSRARTLSEGLGPLPTKSNARQAAPPALNPREISRRSRGVILFYWLGEKQSYLWAITPQKTNLFPLPPGAEIEAMVQRYRRALQGPQDVLESGEAGEDGRALYRTLIAPAKALLAHDAKVLIIPDGSLNNLNFETLVVAEPKPHYWIDDAQVANASSLRLLAASLMGDARVKKPQRRLLLIGDSVAPSKEYPELPRAGQQMANVAKHFPATHEQVYQRDQANPAAYLAGNPEKFSHIHFVAHGTASRLSPLDSAIVLSRGAADSDSFKLYARDIVQHPLHADLVTISACYGAGERAYSGEGLVGLAWAFLRAGAHNVIAGLWEVTDASTEQLMDRFYDELAQGASPDAALRAAKLSLLHRSPYRNPFYWAPFQLYTGS